MNIGQSLTAVFLAFVFLMPSGAFSKNITIGKNYVIFCRDNATVMEQYAAETLQKYIAESAGMKLAITSKASSPAIRIAYDEKLKREELLVKALPGGDLLISGGFPSGVIYGAFEFLEKVMNRRFLAVDAEYVPKVKEIFFPDDLLLRGSPAFLRRGCAYGGDCWRKNMDFWTKLRLSGMWIKGACLERLENRGLPRGPIENLIFRNIHAEDCYTAIRMLSVTAPIRNIRFENIKAGCRCHAINMDAARYCRTPLFDERDYPEGVGKISNIVIDGMEVWKTGDNPCPLIRNESLSENIVIRNFKRRKDLDTQPLVPTVISKYVRKNGSSFADAFENMPE